MSKEVRKIKDLLLFRGQTMKRGEEIKIDPYNKQTKLLFIPKRKHRSLKWLGMADKETG